ncbi:MAG: nucleotide exchange factor GrpE [Deltaproteobacteria bacterium]|jgi:molecular chaperone GrpE|nr:nucleotide exchange factor GrpE [Deltaproteobacteria bacterium]
MGVDDTRDFTAGDTSPNEAAETDATAADLDQDEYPPDFEFGADKELAAGEIDINAPEISDQNPESPELGAVDWEQEALHYRDLYMRNLAEQENTRRRNQKEREETAKFAGERVLRDILPFLDNLYLALDYADRDNPAVGNLAEGVAMTLKGCLDKLAEHGLKEISVTAGQLFDPNFHEAIGQEPSTEYPDRTISRLVARGYSLHDRLLRPARVMVVKNPSL